MIIKTGREKDEEVLEAVKQGPVKQVSEYNYVGIWLNEAGTGKARPAQPAPAKAGPTQANQAQLGQTQPSPAWLDSEWPTHAVLDYTNLW